MRPWVFLLAGCGCTLLNASFEGRACDDAHPCPGSLTCIQNVCTSSGVDAGPDGGPVACQLFDSETLITCAGRDLYVSPTGNDALSGLTPAEANATIGGQVAPGDRYHLAAGRYPNVLFAGTVTAGLPECPVQVFGPDAGADGGGMAVLEQPLNFITQFWWLHDLRFELTGGLSALKPGGSDLRFERLVMRNQYTVNSYARDFEVDFHTTRMDIIGCDVDSANGQVLAANTSINTRLIGNRLVSTAGGFLDVGENALLEGNDISGGPWATSLVVPTGDAGLVVVRNVFHDLSSFGPFLVVQGATEVRSNTFARIASGTAADQGVFRDNIVSGLDFGTLLTAAAADAGYNLFEQVGQPYASGTGVGDQFGASALDLNFVPQPPSLAIDAADPALPVPPGGGSRADIGALERGATAPVEGRYCMDGGG